MSSTSMSITALVILEMAASSVDFSQRLDTCSQGAREACTSSDVFHLSHHIWVLMDACGQQNSKTALGSPALVYSHLSVLNKI